MRFRQIITVKGSSAYSIQLIQLDSFIQYCGGGGEELPYVVCRGKCRWIGCVQVFYLSALNRRYNFAPDILIRVHNFVRVGPNYKHDVNLFVLHVFKSKD